MWYYNMLIRFIENCSGKKVYMKFNPFVENSLSFSDLARCDLWYSRITGFQRILGPRIFLKESLKILFVAFKYKDPTFLANWIKGMLARMSFWKYKLLFRYLKYVMRYLFWFQFENLKFKGLKLRLKGKISVAGNARTRTLVYAIGETSFSKINNKVVSDYSTINTFTGVLGFKVWFFF
jgi:ribosomal protein S3